MTFTRALLAASLLAVIAGPALAQTPDAGTPPPPPPAAPPPPPPPPPDGRRDRDAGHEQSEFFFGWRPSARTVRIEDEEGDRITGRGDNLGQFRWGLHLRGDEDSNLEGRLQMEYWSRDLDAKKGVPGDFSGHALSTRASVIFPGFLGDDPYVVNGQKSDTWADAHWRVLPEVGFHVLGNWGGYGSNIELPSHTEAGPFLGVGLEYRSDEDRNRIGAALEGSLFFWEWHSSRKLGDFEQGFEMRFKIWWSTKINEQLRLGLGYTSTNLHLFFNEGRGLGGLPPGDGAFKWEESDNALEVNLGLQF